MKIACIMDPIEKVNVDADTTFDWLLAAAKRGHELYYVKVGALTANKNQAFCHAQPLTVRRPTEGDPSHYTLGEEDFLPLAHFDVVWMRRDPPFDTDYLYATYVLELADSAGECWVLNRPSSLRDANEKAFILHFPTCIPETVVTHSMERVKAFLADQPGGRCIVKPLDGHGGAEIFMLKTDDLNTNSILESLSRNEKRYMMAQAYLPEAREGDKRVLVIDGEPIGAILRVPSDGELRGNIHVGGRVVKTEVTDRDKEIVATLAPTLREKGLYFVGVDVIGDYMTEINVTSPTGIQEMSVLDGVSYSERWIAWIEDNLPAHQKR